MAEELKVSMNNRTVNQIETILETERKAITVLINCKRDIIGTLSNINNDYEENNTIADCINEIIIKRTKNLIHKLSNCIN